MPTKSKHKLDNQFAKMTPPEAFRAFWKALSEGNHELIDEIEKQLPKDAKIGANKHGTLMFQKINLYNLYLILRADIAISFYNSILGQMFGDNEAEEMFSPEFANKWFHESNKIKEQINALDEKADGILKLEFFGAMEDLASHFDYWQHLVKKIDKKYG